MTDPSSLKQIPPVSRAFWAERSGCGALVGKPSGGYRGILGIGGVFWLGLISGCAAVDLGLVKNSLLTSPSASSPVEPVPLDPTTSQESTSQKQSANPLSEALQTDHWRSGEIWPEPLAGPQALERWRQRPLPHWEQTAFAALRDQHDETTWQAWLAELAEEDSLAGWNACILLASRSAHPLTENRWQRLQELALQPPLYAEAQGTRFVETAPAVTEPAVPEVRPTDTGLFKTGWWNPFPFAGPASTVAPIDQQETTQQRTDETKTASSKEPSGPLKGQPVSDNLRAAAAAAWCYQLSLLSGDPERNFAAAGRALQQPDLPEPVRLELIRGIARKIPPRQIPGIEACFARTETGPVSLSHLAALDACIGYALLHPEQAKFSEKTFDQTASEPALAYTAETLDPQRQWPLALWQDRWEETPEVINRFGLWLAVTNHPLAESYLKQNLQHTEPQVQWQALRNLGLLSSPDVEQKLLTLARQKEGVPRAIAVIAGAKHRPEVAFAFRHDSSVAVRSAIACYAGETQGLQATQTLIDLVADADPVVQKEALLSVKSWSDAAAFPVLSAGFLSSVPTTRKLARQQLEQRFNLMIASLEDSPAQRRQVLDSIARNHTLETSQLSQLSGEAQETDAATLSRGHITTEEQQRWQELINQLTEPQQPESLRKMTQQQLVSLYQQQPQLLEQELTALHGHDLKKRVALLASLPIDQCRELQELESDDIYRRRQAARQLEIAASLRTLAEWKLRLMAERMQQEQDLQVCRHLLQAIAADTTPAARQLATAALLHSWPDVRVLGCRYVTQHRLPQLAPFLLPLLTERNPTVQRAAIEAAGYCQNPLVIEGFAETPAGSKNSLLHSGAPQAGLRSLLGTVPSAIEREVITSLARLGDQQGVSELHKLCYSTQPEVRSNALQTLIELRGQETLPLLSRLGWTEQHPAVRQTILNGFAELAPPDSHPDFSQAFTYEQKLQLWSTWVESR